MREGTSDISLKILIERYARLRHLELEFNESLSQPFNGPLSKDAVRIRTRRNFDSNAVDIAFYFADADKGEFNKLEKIKEAIESVNPAYSMRSIIGIPEPHMEAWLLCDQVAVKRVFGLPGDRPLPYSELEPKSQLSAITNNNGGTELTPPQARIQLSEVCDLTVLERTCTSFNQFIHRFNEYINGLQH